MSSGIRIDEDRLLALYHGELGATETAALEAALADDPAAQALLATWRAQDGALNALYAPVARESVPERLTAVIRRAERPARASRMIGVAALVATLAIGVSGGWVAARLTADTRAGPSVAAAAIAAHETYVVEVRHPVEVAASEEDHLAVWLSHRIGLAFTPPDLAGSGYRLIGGRLVPGVDGAAALLMYEDTAGGRLTLYISRTPETGESAFRFVEDGKLKSFWWTDEGFACAVVGEVPRARLREIARAAYDQLV